MKRNSLCPGVYSLELFECQVYISTCVNTLTSNMVWHGSKPVEKKQIPRATSNLKKKSLQLAAKEEMVIARVSFKELVHKPRAPAESYVLKPPPICLHDTTYLSWYQCWPWYYIYLTDFPDPWPPDTYTAKTFLWNSHPLISQFLTHLFAWFS